MGYVDALAIGVGTSESKASGVILAKVVSAQSVTSALIRIQFDKPMTNNPTLVLPSNYMVTTTEDDAATPLVLDVQPENVEHPTFIDLTITETTNTAEYLAEVNPLGPIDWNGAHVDPGANTSSFIGLGTKPSVESVVAVGENRIDVVFSEPMKNNPAIWDASKYTFDNGLQVISVLNVDSDTVQLVTSDQTPGTLYQLTVNKV